MKHKLLIGAASPVIIMARTYRTSLWDCRLDDVENELGHTLRSEMPPYWSVSVPDTWAFTPRHWDNDMHIDVKLRHADDLAYAEDEIRHALAEH